MNTVIYCLAYAVALALASWVSALIPAAFIWPVSAVIGFISAEVAWRLTHAR